MSSAIFSILAGLGLFFYGLRKLLRGFESFASSRVRPTIQKSFSNPFAAWCWGALMTVFSQSSILSLIALMGLTEMGFIGLRAAFFMPHGTHRVFHDGLEPPYVKHCSSGGAREKSRDMTARSLRDVRDEIATSGRGA